MTVGGYFGGATPGATLVSVLGGGAGAALGQIATGHWRTGYLIGDMAGGIVGTGLDDIARGASRLHALGQTGVTAGFAGGGFAAGYAGSGGDINSALFWGNIASMPGNLIAKKLIPCFRAGTPIRTPSGHTNIEELKAGDLVLARDEHDVSGTVVAKLVEQAFVREGEVLNVHVGGRVIETTPEHPFYVKDKGWTPAGELEIGDILSSDDGRWLPVEDLLATGVRDTVYNLRVAEFHTYFVGGADWSFSIWVHNASRAYVENFDQAFGNAPRSADDVAFGLTRAERIELVRKRPARYRKGVVNDVWENAKGPDGKVYDPNTLEELAWDTSRTRDGQWDMGHRPGKSYDQLKKRFIDGEISRKQFLAEYNDPANYHPETFSGNRSRRYD